MLHETNSITIAQKVYKQIEHLIVFCKIAPNTTITEKELSQLVNVGRTPVREAVKLLEKDSLVTISRAGITIPPISNSTQLDLLELRRPILKLCVECAIKRLTNFDRQNLQILLDDVDNVDFLSWLKIRHEALARASKNQFIFNQLIRLQALSYRFWFYYADQKKQITRKNLHTTIIINVLAENTTAAIQSVDILIDYLEETVRKFQ